MPRERIRLLDKELNTVLIQDAPEQVIDDANLIVKYKYKLYGYNDYFPSEDGGITEYVEILVIEL